MISGHQRTLIVDVDCLFDLRLALVLSKAPESIDILLGKERLWYRRDSDLFIRKLLDIDFKPYRHLYKNNFIDYLNDSEATFLFHNLVPLTNEVLDDDAPGQSIKKRLIVNIPYGRMPDEWCDNLIHKIHTLHPGYFNHISVMHKSLQDLSLYHLKITHGATDYFCYDWSKWLEVNYEKFHEEQSPMFNVWFPKLKAHAPLEKPENYDDFLQGIDEFDLIQYLHSMAFSIRWIDAYQMHFYHPSLTVNKEGSI